MLKNIATAGRECTAKHENKASYTTDYIVPDLIDLIDILAMVDKRSKGRLKKEMSIFLKNITLTKNLFAVSNF